MVNVVVEGDHWQDHWNKASRAFVPSFTQRHPWGWICATRCWTAEGKKTSPLLVLNERITWEIKMTIFLKSHVMLVLFLSEVWLLWVGWAAGFWEGAASIAKQNYLKCIYEMNSREYFSFIFLFFQRMVLTVASCISEICALWCGPWIDNMYEKQVGRERLHLRSPETPDTRIGANYLWGGLYYFFRLNKDSAIKSETFQWLEENIDRFNNTNYIKWEFKRCNILYSGQKPYWKSGSLST